MAAAAPAKANFCSSKFNDFNNSTISPALLQTLIQTEPANTRSQDPDSLASVERPKPAAVAVESSLAHSTMPITRDQQYNRPVVYHFLANPQPSPVLLLILPSPHQLIATSVTGPFAFLLHAVER
ncbi:uncharacterized protein CTHT_0004170 [Thermochaetoides thermophila DSM 1495]|uniref:Uncharacterized protein n=1 Tax=Chaetomium thermophilum (strain DSM 1495 / CBS 144.50 / IMI 039719) TaxID=759272 RepID=G0RZU0_CHATD|nr:hypothetical protein CTHT_0004170 [Thermochaetoides thermophila DSM 1495]EGS23718.1 hypothetical protein CTHT_0004170 [Thermochaetoides thermophila DSM 1495]